MSNASPPRRGSLRLLIVAAACGAPSACAADLPPDLVGRFTRQVQPLLLSRCAAGACHGGPRAHAPRLQRDPATRRDTLANADALVDLLGPAGDPRPLVQRLAERHPATAKPRGLVMQPLTPRERAVLEGWLADAGAATRRPTIHDPAVAPTSGVQPAAAARPNRFRALLDAAANPPELPPPQEPQGIILGKDEPLAAGEAASAAGPR